MAKPSPDSQGTRAIQLVLKYDEEKGKNVFQIQQVDPPPESSSSIDNPLSQKDNRIICITLNRPLILVTDPDGNALSEKLDDYQY